MQILVYSNYYRFKDTLDAQGFVNRRLTESTWAWAKVMPGANAAITELIRIHHILGEASMFLTIADEDLPVLEEWESRARNVPCVTRSDEPYLSLAEMGF